jgi:ATP-dependent DNA helicase RecG
VTGDRAAYIRNRAFSKDYYKNLVLGYLKKFGGTSREDIDALLLDKLSDALSHRQKKNFVTNLLQEMRRQGLVEPDGTTRWAKWVMSKRPPEDRN